MSMVTMRPLQPRPPTGEWTDAHMGGQAMMQAPSVNYLGLIRRGVSASNRDFVGFNPRPLFPKNLITGVPRTNG